VKRPDVWLGDLARALGDLRPSDPGAVLRLFGLEPETAESAPAARSPKGLSETEGVEPPPFEEPDDEEEPPPTPSESVNGVTEVEHLGKELGQLSRAEWKARADALPPPAAAAFTREYPLVVPRQRRGIVVAAASVPVAEGAVDLRQVVTSIAQRRPMAKVARRFVHTARRGARVLVDMGEAMLPFAADRAMLVEALSETLGRGRVAVMSFAGCPSRGAGPGARASWEAFELPRPGTPVVLVTDLGAGGPVFSEDRASGREWRSFLHTARAHGCPVVVFTPYPRSRYGLAMEALAALVHWDRQTTAASVRRVVGLRSRARR
jgi:hypothetical protein